MQPHVVGDRYELLAQIGSGGMGLVYEGFDRTLKRRIAVKFTQPSLSDPGWTKRFFREAEAMARSSHPGLPTIYDAGVVAGSPERPYLVMEFVEGITFDALLSNHGSLPFGVVAALGAQTSAVLAATHRHRIYHRDLKPSNLMLCPDGTVKVLDFGLAVVLDTDVTRYTTTGTTLGTPAYRAPEQVEGKVVVPQTDLYSLGLVLHELLTGKRVMTGGTPFVVWQNQIHRPAPEIESLCDDVPSDMAELLMCMLAKSPAQRPPDASVVHGGLVRHAAGLGSLPEVNRLNEPALMYAIAVGAAEGDEQESTAKSGWPDRQDTLATVAEGHGRDGLRQAIERTRVLTGPDAVNELATVVDAVAPVLGSQDPEVVDARTRLADLYFETGDHVAAADLYTTLIVHLTDDRGPYNDRVLYCQQQLARCDSRTGDARGAVRRLQKLHSQMAIRYGEQDRRVIALAAQIRAVATG
ncbi:serine/threonine-protein kinase [Nocardia salmonicida]|uniref:serine/threonine-protein kinase n=1 Tax=Nocardia salmonicida TaxID=53431 RepID=UPI002E2C4C28|nr:serine/threonine-protein kinase [Nocardia salmonicida]